MRNSKLAVWDIDGTLANCEHRLGYIRVPKGSKKEWAKFFDAMIDDKPIVELIDLCAEMYENWDILLLTDRPIRYMGFTLDWLRIHGIAYDYLQMGTKDDYRDDDITKVIALKEFLASKQTTNYTQVLCFEDRARVVKSYREAGFITAQVAAGDF